MTDAAPTGLAKMREPFLPNQISKLCRSTKKDNPKGSCNVCGGYHGKPSIALDYVGHAALTDRLLDCDPNWSWEPAAFDQLGYPAIDKDGGMWIKLTVCGVTRYGYGDAQGKTGGDAMKERIGDALRNAAMRFGAALDLWHKGDLHVDEDAPAKEVKQALKSAPQQPTGDQGGQAPAPDALTDPQRKMIFAKSKAKGVSEDSLKTAFKVASIADLKRTQVNDVLAWIDGQAQATT